MRGTNLSPVGLTGGVTVTVGWAIALSEISSRFDPGLGGIGIILVGFLVPALVLAIPAGIVVGLIGGDQLYIESGLGAAIGYILTVLLTLAYDGFVHDEFSTLGGGPELLIGLTFAVLVGLVLLPVLVLVGGNTAKGVRSLRG